MKDFSKLPTRVAEALGYDIMEVDYIGMPVGDSSHQRKRVPHLLTQLEKHFRLDSPLELAFLLMFAHYDPWDTEYRSPWGHIAPDDYKRLAVPPMRHASHVFVNCDEIKNKQMPEIERILHRASLPQPLGPSRCVVIPQMHLDLNGLWVNLDFAIYVGVPFGHLWKNHKGELKPFTKYAGLNVPIAIELDGKTFHSTPEQEKKDRLRDQKLKDAGYFVQRFTGEDVWNDVNDICRGNPPGNIHRTVGAFIEKLTISTMNDLGTFATKATEFKSYRADIMSKL